jgi:hypothetical protein
MLFDWLITGQVLAVNPAHAVRGPKHVVKRGKTTVLTADQARELLDSIDTTTLVGLREGLSRVWGDHAAFANFGVGLVTGTKRWPKPDPNTPL